MNWNSTYKFGILNWLLSYSLLKQFLDWKLFSDQIMCLISQLKPHLIKETREALLRHFTSVLGNDDLAAHFILLHVLSRVCSSKMLHLFFVFLSFKYFTLFLTQNSCLTNSMIYSPLSILVCFSVFFLVWWVVLDQVRARVDTVAVGKLSLNLTCFGREIMSVFGNQLSSTIRNLLPFTHCIPLTVDYLNTASLAPRKDYDNNRYHIYHLYE